MVSVILFVAFININCTYAIFIINKRRYQYLLLNLDFVLYRITNSKLEIFNKYF